MPSVFNLLRKSVVSFMKEGTYCGPEAGGSNPQTLKCVLLVYYMMK